MKWLFILAALLNVLFFTYNLFFQKEETAQEPVTKTAEKGQIILLSELDASELEQLQSKVLSEKSQPPKTDIQAFPETSDIELTQESQSSEKVAVADQERMQKRAVNNGSLCFNIGPLKKKLLDDIRLDLEKKYKNNLSFRIETTSMTTYYRIYIPPVESREVRNKTLELLNKHGLEDNYVMSIDGRKNAIALGVFKKRSAAETIAAKAGKIGLATTIEAITDDKNSLYKLQLVFQKNLDLKPYNSLMEKNKLEPKPCKNKG